jgi:hypothetical protein
MDKVELMIEIMKSDLDFHDIYDLVQGSFQILFIIKIQNAINNDYYVIEGCLNYNRYYEITAGLIYTNMTIEFLSFIQSIVYRGKKKYKPSVIYVLNFCLTLTTSFLGFIITSKLSNGGGGFIKCDEIMSFNLTIIESYSLADIEVIVSLALLFLACQYKEESYVSADSKSNIITSVFFDESLTFLRNTETQEDFLMALSKIMMVMIPMFFVIVTCYFIA